MCYCIRIKLLQITDKVVADAVQHAVISGILPFPGIDAVIYGTSGVAVFQCKLHFSISIGDPITRMLDQSFYRDGDRPFLAISAFLNNFFVFIYFLYPGLFPVGIGGKSMNGKMQV